VNTQLEMNGSFSVQTVAVSVPVASHSHRFLEIAYVVKGWAQHTLNGVSRMLSAGDVILIDFGGKHSYDDVSRDLTVINCLFQPGILDASLTECSHFSSLLHSCVIGFENPPQNAASQSVLFHDRDGQILSLLRQLEQEFCEQDTGYFSMIRVLLMNLLICSARLIGMKSSLCPGTAVSWIAEEIRRNPGARHSLTEYSDRFSMRPENLSRLFLHQTGENYSHYLQRTRVELACRLLLESADPIPQVAEKCGYLDNKHFRELFRGMTGVSPRTYRRNHTMPLLRLV